MTKYEDQFEEKFAFINDHNLRKHLGDALRCSSKLSSITSKYPELIRSSLHKTIIIHLASIIEASLHYCVLKLGFKDFEKDWKYININILHTFEANQKNPHTEIISGKRLKKKEKLSGYIDFLQLNRFCLTTAKLYDKKVYDEIEVVRKLRNRIHLISLSGSDRAYNKKDLNSVAAMTKKVLDIVKKKVVKK